MALVRKHNENKKGLAIVEVAIVFPLLLIVTLGAIRYGWLFLKAEQITNAARMGARIAVLPDSTADTVCAAVNNLMTAANINPDDCTVTITPADIGSLQVGDSLSVRVTVPCSAVDIMDVPIFSDLEPEDWNLGAEVTMAKEG
ncbi:MAG: TadE/TadG family type IV pilus assembly protein, partial [Sedimentisphaerales bacterium]